MQARIKLWDVVSLRALPTPGLKLSKRLPVGTSDFGVRISYDCPLDNLQRFWEPPARLMVRCVCEWVGGWVGDPAACVSAACVLLQCRCFAPAWALLEMSMKPRSGCMNGGEYVGSVLALLWFTFPARWPRQHPLCLEGELSRQFVELVHAS